MRKEDGGKTGVILMLADACNASTNVRVPLHGGFLYKPINTHVVLVRNPFGATRTRMDQAKTAAMIQMYL